MKSLKERLEAVETWIEKFEADEAAFIAETESLGEGEGNEVVFMPADEFFRDRKKDN